MNERCEFVRPGGFRCRAWPVRGSEYCFWHDPDSAEDLAQAQQLGGMRRKRERTTAVAYDVQGFSSVTDVQRVIEIAIIDTLADGTSLARNRTLGYLSQVLLKTFEVGDLAERIAAIEAAQEPRRPRRVK